MGTNINNTITVIVQALYGNRNQITIPANEIDMYMLGWLDEEMAKKYMKPEEVDRTVVRLPLDEPLVLVYNKIEDQKCKKYDIIETARIPELNLIINSRCMVCRIDESGELTSILPGDFNKVKQYLAE